MNSWLSNNFIEIFGAVTGIIYVFFEIRQTNWLWPLGLFTSAAYVWIFFTSKLYADMSLQSYYVVISVLGWYWWVRGGREQGEEQGARSKEQEVEKGNSPFEGGEGDVLIADIDILKEKEKGKKSEDMHQGLIVTRIKTKLVIILFVTFVTIWIAMYFVLSNLTDSPVPGWDAFITSLSIIGTWMLARKIYEHWFLWIVVNSVAVILYFTRGLYPTVILYFVYLTMSFIGLKAWKKSINENVDSQ